MFVYISYEPHEAPQVRFTNAQHDQLNQCLFYIRVRVCVCIYKINFLPINVQFNEIITDYNILAFGSQQAYLKDEKNTQTHPLKFNG